MNGSGESYDNDTYDVNCNYETVNRTFENAVQFYIKSGAINIIGLFGILGNVISMIILSRPQMRSSINYLLIGLARCDTILIVTSILLFGLEAVYPYTGYLHDYYFFIRPKITPFVFPLALIAQTISVYLTLTVTVERFVAVCHPLRVKSLCTYGRARWYVIGITVFSILYNLPKCFETEVLSEDYVLDDGSNITIYCIAATDLRNDYLYKKIYIHWVYLFVMYIIPFTSLAILNACIYKQVRRANRERQRLSSIQKREIGLATMLLVVVLVFFVCNFPALVANTLEIVYGAEQLTSFVAMSNLLVTINSSVNFVIYVIFGEKFKRLFLKIFCSTRFIPGSPDLTHDDSFASNGEYRHSIRLNRHGTNYSKNGSLYGNGIDKSLRRAASPIPVVYYPQRTRPSRTYTTMTHLAAPSDWSNNGETCNF